MSRSNPFSSEISFEYGVAQPLSPFVRRFVARNPGPLTFEGTNVYVLGRGEVAVLDPGPDDEQHVEELLAALKGERITQILLTHTHRDHSGAVERLRARTGARLYAFVDADAPRGAYSSGAGQDVAGEGSGLSDDFADKDVAPDEIVEDGDRIDGIGWSVAAVHTPGHAPDHVCYALAAEKALFTGDHIMPWSTSVIAPPEGDMARYMASLQQMLRRDDELYYPGHGGRVSKPKKLVRAYILHRQWREGSILDALSDGHDGVGSMVPLLYTDLDDNMKPAAALSVLAHLEHLEAKGMAKRLGGKGLDARFAATGQPD